jgi:hypothetical protein
VTSIVNRLTVEFFETTRYGAIAQSVGIVTICLLVALLLARELVRAHGGRPVAASSMRALDVAAVPLFVAAGLVILLRALQFL